METWMVFFVIKWSMFFFLPISFGRWIIISNWKYTETSFNESTPLDDWCKLQDKKRFDQDLKRISKIIDKNVRRYNYKNK